MLHTSNKLAQTGAELVVRALEAQGVTHVFGVPGAKIEAVFDALVDSKIKTVVCRHEQNAAFIAGGIGRMTGRAGVAIATSGQVSPTSRRGLRPPTPKEIRL
jgi:acetolactate synthase I/II/III large subunit